MLLSLLTILTLVGTGSLVAFFTFSPQIGARASGKRLSRIALSPNFSGGKFLNPVTTVMNPSSSGMLESTIDFFKGGEERVPNSPLPNVRLDKNAFDEKKTDDVRLTWLGHSTVLIEIDGQILLTDPVFSERASMFSFAGPKRFAYEHPMSIEQLPDIDAIIISHDHYDHLDYHTITELQSRVKKFFVPLGVGSHLELWGVAAEKIVELDWWEESNFNGITLAATPARHFSGRGVTDRFSTLWASWVIHTPKHRLFFGGDSGYFDGFKEIGEKYGPFDITMLECGAYNKKGWPEVHMMPEETAQAHLDLRGKLLLPIHWGKFNLSLHSWMEPVERLMKAAQEKDVQVITPKIGAHFALKEEPSTLAWWRLSNVHYCETSSGQRAESCINQMYGASRFSS